jgi:hypothetical protein
VHGDLAERLQQLVVDPHRPQRVGVPLDQRPALLGRQVVPGQQCCVGRELRGEAGVAAGGGEDGLDVGEADWLILSGRDQRFGPMNSSSTAVADFR